MSASLLNDFTFSGSTDDKFPGFTVTGDKSLDALIIEQLEKILEDLLDTVAAEKIEALILGGGYGRGEGGAFLKDGGFVPYNDYDLVLIHHFEDTKKLGNILNKIHEEHTRRCKIHVDITPISYSKAKRLPHTLTWYELLHGHQVLYGNQDVLAILGHRTLNDLPDSEWGRLLCNRGSGLLFSLWLYQNKSCSIAGDEEFEVFVTRQIEKAWLALGDTWLAKHGKYATQVVKRRDNWHSFEKKVPEWSDYYLQSINFKLSPVFERSNEQITIELAYLSELYSDQLENYKSSESKLVIGFYATIKYIHPKLWSLSYPGRYPRERMRIALLNELRGNTFARRSLIGTHDNYIRIWERYA